MRRIKFLPVFVLLALLLSMCPGVVLADEPQPPPDLTPADIPVDPVIQEAAETNAAIASEIGIPQVEEDELQRRIEEWYREAIRERARLEPPGLEGDSGAQIQAATTVPKGTNYTFTYASEGNKGGSSWGLASVSTSYNLSQRRNNVSAWTFGVGSAHGWAWTGHRFSVSGTGSQLCYVDFIRMGKG